jgi:hypothetical protein
MKIDRKIQIEKACSTDEMRPTLLAPYLDLSLEGKSPRLVATDGHIMAALHVEPSEDDTTGWVSIDALKAMRKIKGAAASEAAVICNGSCQVHPNGASFPRPEAGGRIFPDFEAIINDTRGLERKATISLNADLLKRLADAMGARDSVLTLEIAGPADAVLVTGAGCHADDIGLIMPVRP